MHIHSINRKIVHIIHDAWWSQQWCWTKDVSEVKVGLNVGQRRETQRLLGVDRVMCGGSRDQIRVVYSRNQFWRKTGMQLDMKVWNSIKFIIKGWLKVGLNGGLGVHCWHTTFGNLNLWVEKMLLPFNPLPTYIVSELNSLNAFLKEKVVFLVTT